MLQRCVTSLPVEYGGVADRLGMELGVEVSRADVMSCTRAKLAPISQNNVSLITSGKKVTGRTNRKASARTIAFYFCKGEGHYSRECPKKTCGLRNSKGHLAKNCSSAPASAPPRTLLLQRVVGQQTRRILSLIPSWRCQSSCEFAGNLHLTSLARGM